MKITWNKVTWYSKLIALVLFVALPFVGFWFGIQYGQIISLINDSGKSTTVISNQQGEGYYSDVAEWQTDGRLDAGFSIAYPLDFQADENYSATPSPDWRLNADGSLGQKFLTISIPKAFEPQTNFSDATLTVGESADTIGVADCMKSDPSDEPASASGTVPTMMINGNQFFVFKSASVGAGNIYETTSYRTLHAGACYAVEYTIHSSQIANYPASYNLQPFDEQKLTDVLNRMVGTFQF